MGVNSIFQLFCMSLTLFLVGAQKHVFNMQSYGADPSGRNDINRIMNDVWRVACGSAGNNMILFPLGTYLLNPIMLQGECKGSIEFKIEGVLKASTDIENDHWINFRYVDKLTITGGGLLDGQGQYAWNHNDCFRNPHCNNLPVTINFDFVSNLWIHNITSLNSKSAHFRLFECQYVTLNDINITAPADSPNTDGIHIAQSTNILLYHASIATGDDCVSVGPGTNNFNISNVNCGPGHGISIGSIGKTPGDKPIRGVSVKNCTVAGTINGVQIKSWASPYESLVEDITFQDIQVFDVQSPIVINQFYCPSGKCDPKLTSRVQVRDVRFRNIRGHGSNVAAVRLNCSSSVPCQGIELTDINLTSKQGATYEECENVQGVARGIQIPSSCIH